MGLWGGDFDVLPAPSFENSMSTRRSCRKATAWSHFCERGDCRLRDALQRISQVAGGRPASGGTGGLYAGRLRLGFSRGRLVLPRAMLARTPRSVHCLGAGRRARLGLRPRARGRGLGRGAGLLPPRRGPDEPQSPAMDAPVDGRLDPQPLRRRPCPLGRTIPGRLRGGGPGTCRTGTARRRAPLAEFHPSASAQRKGP